MVERLLDLVSGISLSSKSIPQKSLEKYQRRIDLAQDSDCCYGADCGDCDCGGYCIPSECV